RTRPASAAALAPSPEGSSPVTDRVAVVDWPVSGTAVSGAAVPDACAGGRPVGDWPADDWPTGDWPADDGPTGAGPGLVVSWTGGVTIDQVLSAVHRYQRHRAGLDLPAWGDAGHMGKPDDPPAGGPGTGPPDDESDEAATDAAEGRGRVLSV